MSKNKTRTKDKYRVVYNDTQRIQLENEFRSSEYITIPRKQEIAQKLQLSERQIKIWFQNRRAKKRKQQKRRSTTSTIIATPSATTVQPQTYPSAATTVPIGTTTVATTILTRDGCGNNTSNMTSTKINNNNNNNNNNPASLASHHDVISYQLNHETHPKQMKFIDIDNTKSIYKPHTYTSPIPAQYRPHSYIYDSTNDSQHAIKRKSPSHLSLISSPSSPPPPLLPPVSAARPTVQPPAALPQTQTQTQTQTQLNNHLHNNNHHHHHQQTSQPAGPVKPAKILTQPSWQQTHQQQSQPQHYQFQTQQTQPQSEVFYDAIDNQNIHTTIQNYHTQQDTYNYYNYNEPYQQQYSQQYYQQHYQE